MILKSDIFKWNTHDLTSVVKNNKNLQENIKWKPHAQHHLSIVFEVYNDYVWLLSENWMFASITNCHILSNQLILMLKKGPLFFYK